MLHVFQVDHGRMMKLDMSLTVESVASLKNHIHEQYKINPDGQVLLASGGVMMTNETSVASHSAGTDSNPIYLYDRRSIQEENPPPVETINEKKERELEQKVIKSRELPVNFDSMVKRSQLAQEINEQGREQFSECERLVYEQHLQQQGWRAIVANLDDILLDFRKRANHFKKRHVEYSTERSQYGNRLAELEKDIETLHRIPILPSLLESQDGNQIETDEAEKELTLYDWMSSRNKDVPLNSLFDRCSRGLAQFDGSVFQKVSKQIDDLLVYAANDKLREVTGMSERLSGLEHLMKKAKDLVQNQHDISMAFKKQETNAKNAKDASVLPDLCSSHEKQLQLMADNHKRICDILRKCVNAKGELTLNLYQRLRWVVYTQNNLCEIDQKMVIHEMNFSTLQKYLDIMQQVHTAPSTYLSAVIEVTRRRKFSRDLLMCGSELARYLHAIHGEETDRRQRFSAKYHLGLLAELFGGLDDFPPAFATQAPPEFDGNLPPLTEDDVDRLKRRLPDMEESLRLPDMLAITEFTWSETASKQGDVTKEGEEEGQEEVAVGGMEPDRSERGCDSDTDSGGFENVLNSPAMSPSQYYYLNRKDASTVTEENLEMIKSENEKLKSLALKVVQLAKEETSQLKNEMVDLRSTISSTSDVISQKCKSLDDSWVNVIVEQEIKDKETIEGLRKSEQILLQSIRQQTNERDNIVEKLKSEKEVMQNEITKSLLELQELRKSNEDRAKEIEELRKKGEERDRVWDKCVQDALEKVNRKHKEEKETLKHRLKLMAKMERSPSDNSMEKSTDFSSLMLQMKENFEMDKERSVSEAVAAEREKWEELLEERVREIKVGFEKERKALLAMMSDDRKAFDDELEKRDKYHSQLLEERVREIEGGFVKERDTLLATMSDEKKKFDDELEKRDKYHSKLLEERVREIEGGFDKERETLLATMSDEKKKFDDELEKRDEYHSQLLEERVREIEGGFDKEREILVATMIVENKFDDELEKRVTHHSQLLEERVREIENSFDKEREILLATMSDEKKKFDDELEKRDTYHSQLLEERVREMEDSFDKERKTLLATMSEEKKKSEEELERQEKRLSQLLEVRELEVGIGSEKESISLLKTMSNDRKKFNEERKKLLSDYLQLKEENEILRRDNPNVMWRDREKVDVTTSPIRQSDNKVETSSPRSVGKVSIDSCKAGDAVVIVWEAAHESFKILQENKHMFFLHSDYLEGLGLEIVEGKPNKTYVVGEVVDKEYCCARKSENRYKVPKGMKFFRVKVKPYATSSTITSSKDVTQSLYEPKTSHSTDASRMTRSHTLASTSSEDVFDPPPSPTRYHPIILERDEPDSTVKDGAILKDAIVSCADQLEIPEEKCVETTFAEDSGIVDNVEQALAAMEDSVCSESRNDSVSTDR